MQPHRRPLPWPHALIWAAPWLLVACFAPSDLPPAKSGAAEPTPALLPLSQVLSLAAEGPRSAQLSAPPDARIAALRARADALRGPVIAPSERQRIEAARRRLD